MRQINCQIESAELFNRERIERSESFFCEWLLRQRGRLLICVQLLQSVNETELLSGPERKKDQVCVCVCVRERKSLCGRDIKGECVSEMHLSERKSLCETVVCVCIRERSLCK